MKVKDRFIEKMSKIIGNPELVVECINFGEKIGKEATAKEILEEVKKYFESQVDEEDDDNICFCNICDRAVLGREGHIEFHLKPIRQSVEKVLK